MSRIFVIQLALVLILQIISTYNLRYTPIPPFIDPSIKLGADYSDDILFKKSVFFINLGKNVTISHQKSTKHPPRTVDEVAHDVVDSVKDFGHKVGDGVQDFGHRVGDGVQDFGHKVGDEMYEIGSKVGDGVQHAWHQTVDWFKGVFG
ncbi:uncharacterized protein LOC113495169 isoform X2 [Trichoplusia ni]|uniref:Uncharacterized protein LOC113495169 isoform X2 n=1 Tax=Trichoplusia ni TaxID=7111 RepID=A0A7E5VMT6_TRINI|nr:uncharacterized protein LOC113495169 isoform X2 [Trichoplusia ni]